MANFLPVSGDAIAGSPVNISQIRSFGAMDVVNQLEAREHSAMGAVGNNFVGGAVVTDVAPKTRYLIVFTMNNNQPAQYWEFSSASDRNTALTDDVQDVIDPPPGN